MRALLLGALLVVGLLSKATAQLAAGPIAIASSVNGIPVTVTATYRITANPVGDEVAVDARIFADLIDLQKKLPDIMDSFKRGAGNCNRTADSQNSVVSFKDGALWPRSDQLLMFIRGDIDSWSCTVGRPRSAIRWEKKKIAFIHLKLPVRHTWRTVKKNVDGTQAFHGVLQVSLAEKDDAKVALKIAEPSIKLDGQPTFATNANLNLAMADMSQKVSKTLQSAIDLTKLKDALPKELQKLNMTVVSARFRDRGGHAIAEINLVGRASANMTTSLLQQIAASYRSN
jgi:hypothetical protein